MRAGRGEGASQKLVPQELYFYTQESRDTPTSFNGMVGPGSGARLLADASSATDCVTSTKSLNLSEL